MNNIKNINLRRASMFKNVYIIHFDIIFACWFRVSQMNLKDLESQVNTQFRTKTEVNLNSKNP